jgi:hypothetical protein
VAAFATVEDLATDLQRNFTAAETATASQALDIATQVIKTYTRQEIEETASDSIVLRRTYHPILLLPQVPVTVVTSVNDGTLLVVNTDYEFSEAGVLKRLHGTWRTNVTVVYTHGYPTIPLDIRGVTLSIAARRFTGGPAGNVQGETLGPYRVEYGGTESVVLKQEEIDVLNRYRAFAQIPA